MIKSHQHFDLLNHIILERVTFVPPMMADGSMHNEACFLFAMQGKSHLYSATDEMRFSSNEGVVMKCGNYVNSWSESAEFDECEVIAIHFHPDVLKLVYEDDIPSFLKQSDKTSGTRISKVKTDEMIQKYMESIQFYFENPSMVNDELIKLKVKELILLLINSESGESVKEILKDLFNPAEVTFKDVIETNLFKNLSVDDLAILTNMSASTFKRKFKEIYGGSPKKYIRQRRLEKGKDLLQVSSDRIADIAYACGFTDAAHFTKSFTAEYGFSPSDFRQQATS